MESELARDVVAFVRSETRYRKPIDLDTRLADDIGVDGLDAVEFMEKFVERFKVDLSGIRWDAHFSPEGLGCFWPLSFLWFLIRFFVYRSLKKPLPNQEIPVRVRDLVRAAESGRWPIQYD